MKRIVLLALTTALIGSIAEARPGDRIRQMMMQRYARSNSNAPTAPAPQTLAYGSDPAQALDLWIPRQAKGPVPLVVFVHGGGWQRGSKDNATGQWKAVHYPAQGYAFASIDYRLVPQATVEQQAADIANAIKLLLAEAPQLGIDPHRVVIMGHSAGAQLVALVGTDEGYLRAAGLSFRDLAGVVPIDGAAYDIPAQMQDGPPIMQHTYAQAFGSDTARQRALSPSLQATSPNAPRFLLLHVQRPDGVRQAKELEQALRKAGTPVDRADFPGEGLMGHMEINRRLGDPDYVATGTVDAWLKRVFAN